MQQCASPEVADSRPENDKMTKAKPSKTASLHHVGMFNNVEMALISPLIRSTNFNDDLVSECSARGLLPAMLVDGLAVVKVVARTVLAAQAAQRIYAVPASVLISIAIDKSAFEAACLIKDPENAVEWPGCDCCYSPEIQKWFLKTAALLAESRKYKEAMKLLPDLEVFVKKVHSLGFGSDLDAEDILENITKYGLGECDLAGWLAPGEYRKKLNSVSWSDRKAIEERDARLSALPVA